MSSSQVESVERFELRARWFEFDLVPTSPLIACILDAADRKIEHSIATRSMINRSKPRRLVHALPALHLENHMLPVHC